MKKTLMMRLWPDGFTLNRIWPGHDKTRDGQVRALLSVCFPGVVFDDPPLDRMKYVAALFSNADCPRLAAIACQHGKLRTGGAADYLRRNELAWVATHPDFRGRGLGEALCRFIVGEIQRCGCPQAFVTMNPVTPGAERLYKRLGFIEKLGLNR
jgi:ribosomal protein S18 acetylase RimI-like enzyme